MFTCVYAHVYHQEPDIEYFQRVSSFPITFNPHFHQPKETILLAFITSYILFACFELFTNVKLKSIFFLSLLNIVSLSCSHVIICSNSFLNLKIAYYFLLVGAWSFITSSDGFEFLEMMHIWRILTKILDRVWSLFLSQEPRVSGLNPESRLHLQYEESQIQTSGYQPDFLIPPFLHCSRLLGTQV